MLKKSMLGAFLALGLIVPAEALTLNGQQTNISTLGENLIKCYYPDAQYRQTVEFTSIDYEIAGWSSENQAQLKQRIGANQVTWLRINWLGGILGTRYETIMLFAHKNESGTDYFLTKIVGGNALPSLTQCTIDDQWNERGLL